MQLSGQLTFADSKSLSSIKDLVKLAKDADVVGFDPTRFGKSAPRILSELLEKSPNVKGLALNSTTTNCVDLDYCQQRNIKVTTVMDSATIAVAEFAFLLLLGAARRIFVNGWEAQKRMYKWELGSELWGKSLGIIGMGHIGQRIAVLAKAFGMTPHIWDSEIIRLEETRRESSVGGVLHESDMIVVNLPDTVENKKILSKERLDRLGEGKVIINLSGRGLIDEKAMAQALKEGRISQYAFETDRLTTSPFQGVETSLAFKPISRKTRESAIRSKTMWVINIAFLAGHPTSSRSL